MIPKRFQQKPYLRIVFSAVGGIIHTLINYSIYNMNYKKGFTLIELLVVIAIIGILSVIILATVNNSRQNARDGQRLSDIKQLENALEIYFTGAGYVYPDKIYPATCTQTDQTSCPLVIAGVIPKMPFDPVNGAAYRYTGLGADVANCFGYHLGISLENSNAILTGLKDDDTNTTTGGAATRCGNSSTWGLTAADTGKCNTADSGSFCYAVRK